MELWIRSQDKTKLYKANEIFVESEIINYIETGKHYICVNDEGFGTYKSKERALEVLGEMQEILMPNAKLISNKDFNGNDVKVYGVEYIGSYVYEMPSE